MRIGTAASSVSPHRPKPSSVTSTDRPRLRGGAAGGEQLRKELASALDGLVVGSTDDEKPLLDVLVAQAVAESWMKGILLGAANLRNKTAAAHGQGPMLVPVRSNRARLAMNLAASVIDALLMAHDTRVSC